MSIITLGPAADSPYAPNSPWRLRNLKDDSAGRRLDVRGDLYKGETFIGHWTFQLDRNALETHARMQYRDEHAAQVLRAWVNTMPVLEELPFSMREASVMGNLLDSSQLERDAETHVLLRGGSTCGPSSVLSFERTPG